MSGAITDVAGIRVGHAHDLDAITGCTAVVFEGGARAGWAPPGYATGTRKADVFRETHLNETIHALVLSGGSDYGLDAGGGAMRCLEGHGIGFDVGVAVVPIVPTAILFDLGVGDADRRPDVEMGHQACERATDGTIDEGCVGAGTGATIGNLFSLERATKTGLGTASVDSPYGPIGALAIVNAFGDILDAETGGIIAGLRDETGEHFISTAEQIRQGTLRRRFSGRGSNTTLWVVATEVELGRSELTRLARMTDGALVRTHSPAHGTFDGDVGVAVSTGQQRSDVDLNHIAGFAQDALTGAIRRAVTEATSLGGVPSASDLGGS